MKRFSLAVFGLLYIIQPAIAIVIPAECEDNPAISMAQIEPIYTLTVVQDEVIIKTVIKKDLTEHWHLTQMTCPLPVKDQSESSTTAILQLLNENKIEDCTVEEGAASDQMVDYIFSLVLSFRLFDADFATDCPTLLKVYGQEILECLRTRQFIVDADELFTISLTKNDIHVDLVIAKATNYEKQVYLAIQKIKEIASTEAQKKELPITI